jgi:type VI protein secretion system component VasK
VTDGRLIGGMSADMRGNTEETWMHALGWLERNRLTAALEGALQ